MTYVEKLEAWFQTEKAAGRVVDIKFFPDAVEDEVRAKAVYETVTGIRKTTPLDTTKL